MSQWNETYWGIEATTPLGLKGLCVVDPGLLASSQPWALSRNPFGILSGLLAPLAIWQLSEHDDHPLGSPPITNSRITGGCLFFIDLLLGLVTKLCTRYQ